MTMGPMLCDQGGPCDTMQAAIALGTVVLIAGRASWNNGLRLHNCPNCREPLPPGTIANWPWKAFRAVGGA